MDSKKAIQNEIDDAIFNFTIGENAYAKKQLNQLLRKHPKEKEAWHALAEILWSEKDFQSALKAAEKAHAIDDKDLHIKRYHHAWLLGDCFLLLWVTALPYTRSSEDVNQNLCVNWA